MYLTAVLDFVSLRVVAVKDMASNLENRWRSLVSSTDAKNPAESGTKKFDGKGIEGGSCHLLIPSSHDAYVCAVGLLDQRAKKRKLDESLSKAAPPAKKIAATKPSANKPVVLIKREPQPKEKPIKRELIKPMSVKGAKSDSSFFSAPKPKPKLPSFKKAPPLKEAAAADQNVAQPSAVDPFKDALAAMTKTRSSPTPMNTTHTPPPTSTGLSGKKKKKVSFASDEKLVQIKLIEPAVYDGDVTGVSCSLNVDKNCSFIRVVLCVGCVPYA